MNTKDIGNRLVELCRQGKFDEAVHELYAEDIVSVEAGGPPGMDRTARGKPAVIAKGEWWSANHEVHSVTAEGPFPMDDRFAVYFLIDLTNKPSGQRIAMKEVALYTTANGKIVREEFLYG
ncbi:MAG TPA: nuclear transport factor 2 family protein [Flavobacteriales bacterium]